MADRLLTINIRNYLVKQPVRRRHMKISRYVRERIAHYTKVEEENVKLNGDLNILLIKRHAKSMLPLKVNVKIENGRAMVSPFVVPKKEAPAAATTTTAKKAETKPAAAATTAAPAPAKEKKAAAPKAPKSEAKKEAQPSANK